MLARFGKYGKIWTFPSFFPHFMTFTGSCIFIPSLVMAWTCFGPNSAFCVAGLETYLGWLTKVLTDVTLDGHTGHLNVDTFGAETLSSYYILFKHSGDTSVHLRHPYHRTTGSGKRDKRTRTWCDSLCGQLVTFNKAIWFPAFVLLQVVSTCTFC